MLKWLATKFETRRASLKLKLENTINSNNSSADQIESTEWIKKGNKLLAENDINSAAHCYKKAVDISPSNIDALINLGFVKFELNQFYDAEQLVKKVIAITSYNVDAWYILGQIFEYKKNLFEAENAFRKTIALQIDFEPAYQSLSRILSNRRDLNSAGEILQQGLVLFPDNASMHRDLGNIYLMLGRSTDAILSYQRAAALEPGLSEAFLNLGVALFASGDLDGAVTQYHIAIDLKPNYDMAYDNLGIALAELGQTQLALNAFERALAINPSMVSARCNIGSVRLSEARLDEAIDQYKQALSLDLHNMAANSNLLFALNYHPTLDATDIYAAYQHFEKLFGIPLCKTWEPFKNNRLVNRRLRVGYVSPDFRQHSVMRFLEPILNHHDNKNFEVFAYAEVNKEDAATQKAKSLVSQWRSTVGKTDEAVVKMIRDDQIDILVDVAGHTGGNRLLVFARKPAPVSLSWMGYGYTTGLKAIDYYLTDEVTAPIGSEHLFSESLWRMKRTPYVYRPDSEMGSEGSLPVTNNGFVTFGSLTRPIRINHNVVRVWAEILRQVPNSKMIINSKSYGDEVTRDALVTQFVALGIDPLRLEIGYTSPPWDVLRSMDISLDCFPHNSGTTLFESLYMGVPYVTLASRPSVGRIGASILQGLGKSEWIAYSETEYVELAVKLALDIPSLSKTRLSLRQQMKNSCLMDESGFTNDLETAYRDMFKTWAGS